ncbi:MAG: DUF2029 domain-containing protein [Bacteroidetes bacterium]|nr:DUF2029 domain-containing protein [Bacteroidota bacterium]
MLAELWKRYKGKWWVWGGIILILIFSIFLSLFKTSQVYTDVNDFSCIYTAGWHFIEGNSLYGQIYPHIPQFLYPPFAAFIFSSLAIFPPPVACFIFTLINLLLIPVVIFQIINILSHFNLEWESIKIPLLLSILFSLRYFWSNFNLGQVNLIILSLTLVAILSFLKDKFILSGILISIAFSFKILPAVFLFWIFVKKPNVKILVSSLTVIVLFSFLPFLFRGISTGVKDLNDFYIYVLQPQLLNNPLFSIHKNQSVSAAALRLIQPSSPLEPYNFNIINLTLNQVGNILLIIKVILTASFLYLLFIIRRTKKKTGILEISIVFLFIHLVSPITWKNHMVTLVFCLLPLFSLRFRKQVISTKIFMLLMIILLIILSANAKIIIGKTLIYYIEGFSLYTIMLLSLYIYYTIQIISPNQYPSRLVSI